MTQGGAPDGTKARTWGAGVAGVVLGFLIAFLIWGPLLGERAPKDAAGAALANRKAIEVTPADFAILPCPRAGDRGACVVIAAGGKRVLVGAPAGLGAPPPSGEGALGADGVPDAILLLSLDAAQIEGIDEIRSRIWESGASQLPFIGGVGIDEINAGLDQTYIVPDAVAYVRGQRRRSFDKAPLAVRTVGHGDVAFDTGDLTISALAGGAGRLAYQVSYGGQSLTLSDCNPRREDIVRWPMADHYLGCERVAGIYAMPAQGGWPLTAPVFIPTSVSDETN